MGCNAYGGWSARIVAVQAKALAEREVGKRE